MASYSTRRKLLRYASSFATGSLITFGYIGSAQADGYYKFVNRHSGKCLDVQYDSRNNGAALVQYDCHDGWNQQWSMRPAEDGFMRLVGRNSLKAVEVWGITTADQAPVKQYDYWGGWHQQWDLEPTGDGYYKLVNRYSGKLLEIYGMTSNNEAPAVQWGDWGGWNQQWKLMQAGADCERDHCAFSPPGPGQTNVRGTLEYRECLPWSWATGDNNRCATSGDLYKPIRRARVEVWSSGHLTVTESNNRGQFQAVIPSGGYVDVVVVASGPAGQVNWRDNAVTWFWKDLNDYRYGASGSTLVYDWRAERDDARHFNALDVTLRGLEYALEQTHTPDEQADAVFHRVSVIPRWAGGPASTLAVGLASHIWASWDDDIFDDTNMLHEYGHHLERMNGTYAAWPAFHSGCYATADAGICRNRSNNYTCNMSDNAADGLCWVNSPEYAWFEAFPTFYARAVHHWDNNDWDNNPWNTNHVIMPVWHGGQYRPGSCDCPLVTSPHYNNAGQRITPAGVEDYVLNALWDLRNDPSCPGGARAIDGEIFRTWWWGLDSHMPTIHEFRELWNDQYPGNCGFDDILTDYGMICAHDTWSTGEPLDPTCDGCVDQICEYDPYCCGQWWDEICVAEVGDICG